MQAFNVWMTDINCHNGLELKQS